VHAEGREEVAAEVVAAEEVAAEVVAAEEVAVVSIVVHRAVPTLVESSTAHTHSPPPASLAR